MARETERGRIHAQAARSLFVRAVYSALAADAKAELSALSDDRDSLQGWAKRWDINAPCVIDAALVWRSGHEALWWDSLPVSPSLDPHPWLVRRLELDTQPAQVGPYVDPRPVISPEAEKDERARLAEQVAQLQQRVDRLVPIHAHALEMRLFFLDNELPTLRLAANERERAATLAPLAFDPAASESVGEFVRRARRHADARRAEAESFGLRYDVREAPELKRDVAWLVRFQVRGESYGKIAASTSGTSSDQVVIKAVKRVAQLVGLTLRTKRESQPA